MKPLVVNDCSKVRAFRKLLNAPFVKSLIT